MIRAGSAQVAITPPLGTHMAGDGAGIRRSAQKVLDPLYAKALVVECGARRLALLALDVICITEEYTRQIRAAARGLGFEPEAVMVHALQNHSAPSIGCMMLDPDFPLLIRPGTEYVTGSERAYCDFAVPRAIEALKTAVQKLAPVEAAYGRGMAPNLAFNRRGIGINGSNCMPWFYSGKQYPLGPLHLCSMEGPDDPEVGVIAFRAQDLRLRATLLNFACHPVNLYATHRGVISADWPGAWATAMGSFFETDNPFMVLNGCCGNLNPWPPMTPDFKPDHRRMGLALAEMARKVMERMQFAEVKCVEWRFRRIPLPYRDIPKARLQEVDRILKRHPQPAWNRNKSAVNEEWFLAASTRSIEYCRRRMPEFLYEIQVFRVGDAFIVGLSGEPFIEGQLAIKTLAPLPFIQVAHMCSHYTGYLPTGKGIRRGGHEANAYCTYWAKLAPEALDIVVRNVKEMMKELTA
ncbi:MAG: hypothetical protein PHW60_04485 [Kiritimatiellae bacterium]|nr:hypothetical protein [Kiritimatiellia bacterium]